MTGLQSIPVGMRFPIIGFQSLFVSIRLACQPWQELRRIRIATCPYRDCKRYTSVFSINYDGSIGDPIVGWPGDVTDGPLVGDYWWDEQPWCWMLSEFLDGTAGSNQTYTSSSSWNNSNNTVEIIGAGGSGARARDPTPFPTGGGAGAYQLHNDFTFAVPGTTQATYQLGLGGVGGTTASSGTNEVNGNVGGDSWFDGATYGASTVGAKGGAAGLISGTGASGGLASGGRGNGTGYNGGGSGASTGIGLSTGGGGAGGPDGAGAASPAVNGSPFATDGGAAGNGSGGAAGAGVAFGDGGPGGAGTEWDGTHGSGGGGGGAVNVSSVIGGAGGLYGGASGGAAFTDAGSGTATTLDGKKGLIVLTYIPPFPIGRALL